MTPELPLSATEPAQAGMPAGSWRFRRWPALDMAKSGLVGILVWTLVAAAAFHTAYGLHKAGWLIVVYLFALLQLAQAGAWRRTYYVGLSVGFLIAVVWLAFFWRIFSAGSIGLWYVYAFWIGLFVALAGACVRPKGDDPAALPARALPWAGWLLIPFLWTGLEYFRSELYYLRFSWLSPGYVFADGPWRLPLQGAGNYGLGFLLMSVACAACFLWRKSKARSFAALALGTAFIWVLGLAGGNGQASAPAATIRVGGVQMECPSENEVLLGLDNLIRKYPDLDLIVLSEYTFFDQVPGKIKAWCRKNRRFLVVGGEDPGPGKTFYNTAFVIGPNGDVVFHQAKAVPIQFFKDGLPAPEQKVWDSPWGKIGICICYDLSYTRVTDRLVKLGAQALIVPTMDVMDWGQRQHTLHARIAPTRAAEYGLPIFRVASSGFSQLVDRAGRILATAPCPGDGAIICGTIEMRGPGQLPFDRWLAPFATGVAGLTIICLLFRRRLAHRRGLKSSADLRPALLSCKLHENAPPPAAPLALSLPRS